MLFWDLQSIILIAVRSNLFPVCFVFGSVFATHMVSANQSSHGSTIEKQLLWDGIVHKALFGSPPLNVLKGVCRTTLNTNARYAKQFFFYYFLRGTQVIIMDKDFIYEVFAIFLRNMPMIISPVIIPVIPFK